MDETKHRSDPTHGYQNQTFEEQYAGAFVAERKVEADESIEHECDTGHSEREPNPMEMLQKCWTFIKDPTHSGAVIAILTLTIAVSNACYDVVAYFQLSTMGDALKLERPWVGPMGRTSKEIQGPLDPQTHERTIMLTGAEWYFQNGGRIPAVRTRVHIVIKPGPPVPHTVDISRDDLPKDDVCERGELEDKWGTFTVLPNIKYSYGAFFTENVQPFANQIDVNKAALWLVGCVDYSDSTGKWYRTNVLEYWDANPTARNFAQWQTGNDAR